MRRGEGTGYCMFERSHLPPLCMESLCCVRVCLRMHTCMSMRVCTCTLRYKGQILALEPSESQVESRPHAEPRREGWKEKARMEGHIACKLRTRNGLQEPEYRRLPSLSCFSMSAQSESAVDRKTMM